MNLVQQLKDNNQDFEWYPTTSEQIELINSDLKQYLRYDETEHYFSVLDVAAGDGRVVSQLTKGKKYAIEKSDILVRQMPSDIFVVGSDFFQNQLMDKEVDVIFSNPPYTLFQEFVSKIILECHCSVLYFVIPERWKNSEIINQALKTRKFTDVSVIASSDFETADRVSRAKVDIVKIETGSLKGHRKYKSDPFSVWFNQNFPLQAPKTKASEFDTKRQMQEAFEKQFEQQYSVTTKKGVLNVLCELYSVDMDVLIQTYQSITKIPHDLIQELGINSEGVKESLKMKIKGLKNLYWRKLFDELHSLTSKLTTKTRKELLDTLLASTHVDFNEANATQVVIWAIKQSNEYFDSQLIDVYETMTESANVVMYKSNQGTISEDNWRYTKQQRIDMIGKYQLDYRIVLHKVGGYNRTSWEHTTGISVNAANLIADLMVIAQHAGFDVQFEDVKARQWESGKMQAFYFKDAKGEIKTLLEARAYINGNLHIKLNQLFIQKLNVMHGRLKGWIRSADEAAKEMNIPKAVVEDVLKNINMQIKITGNVNQFLLH